MLGVGIFLGPAALRIFPNEAAIRRLVGAILMEQTEEWTVQRARYTTLPSWGFSGQARIGAKIPLRFTSMAAAYVTRGRGKKNSFIESNCSLENPTALRDMPEAKLYDIVFNGEGQTWSERALIGTDGDNLLVYSRGHARSYKAAERHCRGGACKHLLPGPEIADQIYDQASNDTAKKVSCTAHGWSPLHSTEHVVRAGLQNVKHPLEACGISTSRCRL